MNIKKWGKDANNVGKGTPDFAAIQRNVTSLNDVASSANDYADLKKKWETAGFYMKKAEEGGGHYWFTVGFLHSVRLFISMNDVSYSSYSKSG